MRQVRVSKLRRRRQWRSREVGGLKDATLTDLAVDWMILEVLGRQVRQDSGFWHSQQGGSFNGGREGGRQWSAHRERTRCGTF